MKEGGGGGKDFDDHCWYLVLNKPTKFIFAQVSNNLQFQHLTDQIVISSNIHEIDQPVLRQSIRVE